MKTQIKKIAIAITMILSFFGEVNAQSDTAIYAAKYQVSFFGKMVYG